MKAQAKVYISSFAGNISICVYLRHLRICYSTMTSCTSPHTDKEVYLKAEFHKSFCMACNCLEINYVRLKGHNGKS